MLEGKLIELLKNFLEPYVDGIDPSKLQFKSLLGGKVVLHNLHLKPSVIDFLEIPYHLTFGFIGELALKLHFRMLYLSKTKLIIDVNDLIILCTAKPECQWDSKAYRDQYIANKVAALAAESLQLVVREIQGGGFFWKALVSFMETLEIVINNIHIRIEDYTTNPRVHYAIGCVIQRAVFHTDSNKPYGGAYSGNLSFAKGSALNVPFKRCFYNENGNLSSSILHRTIDLEGVGLYIDQLEPLHLSFLSQTSDGRYSPMDRNSNDSFDFDDTPTTEGATFVDAQCSTNYRGNKWKYTKYLAVRRISKYTRRVYIKKTLKKRFLLKSDRLRNVRCKCDVREKYALGTAPIIEVPCHRQANVIGSNNMLYTNMLFHLLQSLVDDEHCETCEHGTSSLQGWQKGIYRDFSRRKHDWCKRYVNPYNTCNVRNNNREFMSMSKSRLEKHHHKHFKIRKNSGRIKSFFSNIDSNKLFDWKDSYFNNLRRHSYGLHRDSDMSAFSLGSTASDGFKYDLSSTSSWRVLLSTFCTIVRHPDHIIQTNALDLLLDAQLRRKEGKHVKAYEQLPIVLPDLATNIESQDGENLLQQDGLFSTCVDGFDCALDDKDVLKFETLGDSLSGPLSYDENWHTNVNWKRLVGTDSKGTSNNVESISATSGSVDTGSSGRNSSNKPGRNSWTMQTFVINEENAQMKELFLQALLEGDHNWILNPKDFKGLASFYFCGYPTPTLQPPITCWSNWGGKHGLSGTIAGTHCLPRCTVFVTLEDLYITISKDQLDAILNLLYENIFKYYNWEGGVIYTFETPRASPQDARLYMEYWPQYLLLDQCDKKNQLREFIMDFEILHSVQVIRILRNSASESLRSLIREISNNSVGTISAGRECVTNLLFSNLCGHFGGTDDNSSKLGVKNSLRLQARLQLVGGMYELAASKKSRSGSLLNSLKKICPEHTQTVDFALDFVLYNSSVIMVQDMDSLAASTLSTIKSHMLTANGLHLYLQDVYGRDGSQYIELEMMPFCLFNIGFTVFPSTEIHTHLDCACRLLDGPATILLSCGDATTTIVPKAVEHVHRRWNIRKNSRKNSTFETFSPLLSNMSQIASPAATLTDLSPKFSQISDSILYMAFDFKHFCTPNEADTRVLFHINSELFMHLRLMEELNHIYRILNFNIQNFGVERPVFVETGWKKAYHQRHEWSDSMSEVYELIDLGVEYYKNLIHGEIPHYNMDLVVDCNRQVLILLDLDSRRGPAFTYFVTLDSLNVSSQVKPRVLDAQMANLTGDTVFYSHFILLSNMRVFSHNGNFDFVTNQGRVLYTGVTCHKSNSTTQRLIDYVRLVTSGKLNLDVIDEEFLSLFTQNHCLLALGTDTAIFMKIERANCIRQTSEHPNTILTINLGSVYVNCRNVDITTFVKCYSEYIQEYNNYVEATNTKRSRIHRSKNVKRANTTDVTSYALPSTLRISSREDYREFIRMRWHELQHQQKNRPLVNNYSIVYDVKLDYLYVGLMKRVPVCLHCSACDNILLSTPMSCSNQSGLNVSTPGSPNKYIPMTRKSLFEAGLESRNNILSNGLFRATIPLSKCAGAVDTLHNLSNPRNIQNIDIKSSNQTYNTTSRSLSMHEAFVLIKDSVEHFGASLPTCSIKVTCVAVTCHISDKIENLRVCIGNIEVVDDSNSVPLYSSSLFNSGDSALFWRWLKVKREVNALRCLLAKFKQMTIDPHKSTIEKLIFVGNFKNDTQLKQIFKHVNVDSVASDFTSSFDFSDGKFFKFINPNNHIEHAYNHVENLIISTVNSLSGSYSKLNASSTFEAAPSCALIAGMDSNEEDIYCMLHLGSFNCLIAWEFMDELTSWIMGVMSDLKSIPIVSRHSVYVPNQTVQQWSPVKKSNFCFHMEQSNITIQSESAWHGYTGAIKFMWFKLLRYTLFGVDSFADQQNPICGTGQHDSTDSGLDSAIFYENSDSFAFGVPGTSSMTSIDSNINQNQPNISYKGNIFVNCKNEISSSTRWSFIRLLLTDGFMRAYLIAPTSVQFSLTLSAFISISPLLSEYRLQDCALKIANLLSPCHISFDITCRNLSVEQSRIFNGRILSSFGYDMNKSKQIYLDCPLFKQHHFHFIKFALPYRGDDSKSSGRLELTRNSLYDASYFGTSVLLQPCRFNFVSGFHLYESTSKLTWAKCVAYRLKIDALILNCSLVDILCLIDLFTLLSKFVDSKTTVDLTMLPSCSLIQEDFKDNCTRHLHNKSSQSDAPSSIMTTNDLKNSLHHRNCTLHSSIITSDDLELREFHSCSSVDTQDNEWDSVSSLDLQDHQNHDEALMDAPTISAKKSIESSSNKDNDGSSLMTLFSKLACAGLKIGVQLDIELLDIKVSSVHVATNQLLVVTAENVGFYFWTNGNDSYSIAQDGEESFVATNFAKQNEANLSVLYSDYVSSFIDVCTSSFYRPLDRHIITPILNDNLFLYEGYMCITVDVCYDSTRDMILESTQFCIRGRKESFDSILTSNFTTSWINLNVTLDLARFAFDFIGFSNDLLHLRLTMLNNAHSEYLELQPVPLCDFFSIIRTSMIPLNILPKHIKHNILPFPGIGIFPSSKELRKWFEQRWRNGLFKNVDQFHVHQVLTEATSYLYSLHAGVSKKTTSAIAERSIISQTQSYVHDSSSRAATLHNNLGQPLAVCTNFTSTDTKWIIVQDGSICSLPTGAYGILLPFIVRIQINNCIYELPSYLFNSKTSEEILLKLDISTKLHRQRLGRIAFSKKHQQMRQRIQYKFGVDTTCLTGYHSRAVGGGNILKIPVNNYRRTKSIKRYQCSREPAQKRIISSMFKRIFVPFKQKKLEKGQKDNFCKYAYIMTRTVQCLGATNGTIAPQNRLDLYLSSTLFISNKSRETLVVFPCLGIGNVDKASGHCSYNVASTSSGNATAVEKLSYTNVTLRSNLIWINHNCSQMASLPISSSTLEYLHHVGTRDPSNGIFKQIANIQHSKRLVKKVVPSHILEPVRKSPNVCPMLQHIVLDPCTFKEVRIAIPLSWTIEMSCSICIALHDDFKSMDESLLAAYTRNMYHSNYENSQTSHSGFIVSDVLLSKTSLMYLYESFEHQWIKSPIPGYTAQVALGKTHVDVTSLLDSHVVLNNHHVSNNIGQVIDVTSEMEKFCLPMLKSQCGIKVKRIVRTTAVGSSISQLGNGIILKRRRGSNITVQAPTVKLSKPTTAALHTSTAPILPYYPPAVILSCTLYDVACTSRTHFSASTTSNSSIRNFEICMESCQIIENMMPYNLTMLDTRVYESFVLNCPAGDMNGCVIKAGSNSHFPLYKHCGRFIMENLASKEFKIRIKGEDSNISHLIFEKMPSELYESMIESNLIRREHHNNNTFPDTVVVAMEIMRTRPQIVGDKHSTTRRCLACAQVCVTLYSEYWVVNWLKYPILLCKNDERYKQNIASQRCTLAMQDLTANFMHLEIRKTNFKLIDNFESYPRKQKHRWYNFDSSNSTYAYSSVFMVPDLTSSYCSFNETVDYPNLHYLISSCMAPAPFYRTSVLEILPMVTLTNDFGFPIWVREAESHKNGVLNIKKVDAPWYRIDIGLTIEFHSQLKGELSMEMTGIDPSTCDEDYYSPIFFLKYLDGGLSSRLSLWSCPFSIKPSTIVRLRYPLKLNTFVQHEETLQQHDIIDTPKPNSIKYGICEIDVHHHRGAKMVKFAAGLDADWVILNNTGIDIWIEQQGVSGFGEVVQYNTMDRLHSASDFTSCKSLQYAWYDPNKDHKLSCRFHFGPRTSRYQNFSRSISINKHYQSKMHRSGAGATAATGSGWISSNWASLSRASKSMSFLTSMHYKRLINKRANNIKVKGALSVDLRHFESVRTSSSCRICFGNLHVRVRLSAQTVVLYGHKTLVLSATRLVSRGLQRFVRFKGSSTVAMEAYNELKNKYRLFNDDENNIMDDETLGNKKILSSFAGRGETLTLPKARKSSSGDLLYSKHHLSKVNINYTFKANVLGFGISICSHVPDEFLYLSLTMIKYKQKLQRDEEKRTLTVGWLQCDVHDVSTCYPNMLRPMTNFKSLVFRFNKSKVASNAAAVKMVNKDSHKILTILFNIRKNKFSHLMREITNFSIELEPLSLNLDTRICTLLLLLLNEYMTIAGLNGHDTSTDYFRGVGIFSRLDLQLDDFGTTEYSIHQIASSRFKINDTSGMRYNISMLHVGRLVIVINISRSGNVLFYENQPSDPLIRYLIHILKRAPAISDANIILAQESMLELCCNPYALFTHFGMRYLSQGVQQIYKVLGAMDLIGNPKMILHHWINGIYDSFENLKNAIKNVRAPHLMIFLLLRATARICTAFLSGLIDAVYRTTGSLYFLLNTLSGNSDRFAVLLMQEVFRKPLGQPANVIEGFVIGGKSLARNLYISIGNFGLKPFNAVSRLLKMIRTTRGKSSQIFPAIANVFGSLISGVASLGFGIASGLLSCVSIAAQGMVNEMNSSPVLSAVRPRRSLYLLKCGGPIRYNFLESWSMDGARHVESLNDVLLILPISTGIRMYAVPSHWDYLLREAEALSRLMICHIPVGSCTFLWIDRQQVGLVRRGKVKWRCDASSVTCIQLFKISYPRLVNNGGSVGKITEDYEDSISITLSSNVAKRFYGTNCVYYLRIVHSFDKYSGSLDATKLTWKESREIPNLVLKRFLDPSTFPQYILSNGTENTNSIQIAGKHALPSSSTCIKNNVDTRVERLYSKSSDIFNVPQWQSKKILDVDYNERRDLNQIYNEGETFKGTCIIDKYTRQKQVDSTCINIETEQSIQSKNTREYMAKVLKIPNEQVAKLYFALLTSVLKEATL